MERKNKQTQFILIEINERNLNTLYKIECEVCGHKISLSITDKENDIYDIVKVDIPANTHTTQLSAYKYKAIVSKKLDIILYPGVNYVYVEYKCCICKRKSILMVAKCV